MAAPASSPSAGKAPRAPDSDAGAHVHIASIVVRRIAAYHAAQVLGVSALQPKLTAAATRQLTQLVRSASSTGSEDTRAIQLNPDGVQADVDDDTQTTTIEIDIVIDFGAPCLATATAIQQVVDSHVEAETGLKTVITVNIVDINIDLPSGEGHRS